MAVTETSDQGVRYLEATEGVVLKAYRDPIGKLTIGAGLTDASGVIDPKPGMVITRDEATRLLQLALRRNYEPDVVRAMPGAEQHAFDGGVSFHFNTGAIARASWVAAWRRRDWPQVAAKIMLWVRGGGRVLPGLERRRREELAMIRDGVYPGVAGLEPGHPNLGRWGVALSPDEIDRVRAAFRKLGYEPGQDRQGVFRASVIAFQVDHDLTVDGILGRATLSTLQRRLDARRKSATTTATGAAGAGGTEAADASGLAIPDWAIWVVLALVGLAALRLAWRYRDVVAAKTHARLPGLARLLRKV